MKISEAIKELKDIQLKYGDTALHLEVGEDVDCVTCGNPRYLNFCGMCDTISIINIDGKICVWLMAKKD